MNSSEIFVSLDIGTSNIKVIIAEVTNDALNIIGVGHVKSSGIKKGAIVDIDETVHSIRKAVEQAERMIGANIRRVVVGIIGNHIDLQTCHGVVAVSSENREINDVDISRVIDAAQVMSIPKEREIIDVIPEQFIVDGLDGITDPRGMIGVRLEMEGTIITCSKTVLHNILRCIERAGLQVIDVCLQPLATGAIALSKDEKNLGVALIEFGGGSTTVSVFDEGKLRGVSVLPVGGDHITNDLSKCLRISMENAEKVKVKYGHAFYDTASEEEVFEVDVIGSDRKQQFNQLEISDIIEARIEEIFDLVYSELKKLGYRELPGGFVLTGGASAMPGILELAQTVLRQNARIAIPDYIGVREPQYTTGVGLVKFAYQNMKIQGKEVAAALAEEDSERTPKQGQESKSKGKPSKKKKLSNVKQWIGYFFE